MTKDDPAIQSHFAQMKGLAMRPEHRVIRVVILDDHAVVQHGISSYLAERMTLQWWRASGNRVT
jgi:hypothetical protein